MKLKGWEKELPDDIEQAIKDGKLKVIEIKFKGIVIELLQGDVKVGNTMLGFK